MLADQKEGHPMRILNACAQPSASAEEELRPTDPSGRALNLDFESGDLRDWTPQGEAFRGQPVEGDAVAARRSDMKSGHEGRFWVGSYERGGDAPRDPSRPLRLTPPATPGLAIGQAPPTREKARRRRRSLSSSPTSSTSSSPTWRRHRRLHRR